jgi:hypothetical protein
VLLRQAELDEPETNTPSLAPCGARGREVSDARTMKFFGLRPTERVRRLKAPSLLAAGSPLASVKNLMSGMGDSRPACELPDRSIPFRQGAEACAPPDASVGDAAAYSAAPAVGDNLVSEGLRPGHATCRGAGNETLEVCSEAAREDDVALA